MRILKKVVFFLLLCIPIVVEASSGIENFYVNAVIEENGDITVEEYFYLNGEFNGMDREILFQNEDAYSFRPELEYYGGSTIHNGSDIILEDVRALPIDESFDFQNISGTIFEEVSSADPGDYGVYTITSFSDGESYRIFLPDRKNEAFYLKYTLKNMAVVHDDVAEIYWNVIGDDLRESIETLKIRITFPNNQNEFRIWAHGPLNGKITKTSNQVLEAEVHNVRSYEAVDVRAVFDKNVVSKSAKLTHVTALDKILAYEENQANQANYEREQQEYQYQEKAYQEIADCEEYATRSCYLTAKSYADRVTDEEIKNDLNEKLSVLLTKVVEKEEEKAKEYTELALEYKDYYWYESALDAVSILENTSLKNSLLIQLEDVKAEIIRDEEEYNQKVFIVTTVLIVASIILAIVLYIKCDKERKVNFTHKYLRDFPNDFSPSTVEYLFKKKMTNNSYTSEVLYMIYQKKIIMIQTKDDKDILLKKDLQYEDKLNEKEKAINDFIFGSGTKTTLKDLKKRVASSTTAYKKWERIEKKMHDEAVKEKLFENETLNIKIDTKKKSSNIIWIILFVFFSAIGFPMLSFLLLIFLIIIKNISIKKVSEKKNTLEYHLKIGSRIFAIVLILTSLFGILHLFVTNHFVFEGMYGYILLLIVALCLFLYSFKIQKRTEKGALAFAEWKAFQRFLLDFGKMDEKELPEVVLWEKYLVYATALGCAKKVSKVMNLKIKDMNIENMTMFDPFIFTHFHMISSGVTSSIRSVHSYSSSSGGSNWSSGSGGGGGFSSGGGFGGGGGGGGRF